VGQYVKEIVNFQLLMATGVNGRIKAVHDLVVEELLNRNESAIIHVHSIAVKAVKANQLVWLSVTVSHVQVV
jgi:hypothetical protein